MIIAGLGSPFTSGRFKKRIRASSDIIDKSNNFYEEGTS